MDLTTAIELVYDYSRTEEPDHAGSAAEAVQWHRDELDHEDIDGAVDDRKTNEAFHKVLDASDAEIARALP